MNNEVWETKEGMTLQEYAAIKLRVPNSGTDWLDEMIKERIRDDVAAKALQGMLSCPNTTSVSATSAYRLADAMMKARDAK